jgi:hypothetical protein
MVLSDQSIEPNIPVPEIPETNIPFDTPAAEGAPQTPEGIPAIGNSQTNDTSSNSQQQEPPVAIPNEDPQPGKIVDKASKHKERIVSLSTPDPVTQKADEEENDFIPKVEEAHDTTHE